MHRNKEAHSLCWYDNILQFQMVIKSKITTPFILHYYFYNVSTPHSSIYILHLPFLTLYPTPSTCHSASFSLTVEVGVWLRRNPSCYVFVPLLSNYFVTFLRLWHWRWWSVKFKWIFLLFILVFKQFFKSFSQLDTAFW